MNLSLSTMLRVTVLVAIVANTAAIGIARLSNHSRPNRVESLCSLGTVNGFFLRDCEPLPTLLNSTTGEVGKLKLECKLTVNHPSFSPWKDEDGNHQIVARWSTSFDPDNSDPGTGIARFSYPDGKLIDRYACDTFPSSSPVWFPGTEASVLFPGSNGYIYRMKFPEDRFALDSPEPELVQFATDALGSENYAVSDLHWPRDPRFQGKLLATIAQVEPQLKSQLGDQKIWVLDYDAEANAIVGATLLPTDVSPLHGSTLRFPTVVEGTDGSISLMALSLNRSNGNWSAWSAPLVIESADLHWKTSEAQCVVDCCIPSQPAISSDGNWLTCLAGKAYGPLKVIHKRLELRPVHQLALFSQKR